MWVHDLWEMICMEGKGMKGKGMEGKGIAACIKKATVH